MTLAGSNHDWPVRRSYSQPCHGQRSDLAGTAVVVLADAVGPQKAGVLPRHSGPPWCGQRFSSAKNSPPTLNTPIDRPPTSTILRAPGGISSTVATTYFGIQVSSVGSRRPTIVTDGDVLWRGPDQWEERPSDRRQTCRPDHLCATAVCTAARAFSAISFAAKPSGSLIFGSASSGASKSQCG